MSNIFLDLVIKIDRPHCDNLLAMPPAWIDFSWELLREERDNVKCLYYTIQVTN
jgi:hypothetical protein